MERYGSTKSGLPDDLGTWRPDRDEDGRPDLEAGAADDAEENRGREGDARGGAIVIIVFASFWMAIGLHAVTSVTTSQHEIFPASYYMQLFVGAGFMCFALFMYAGAGVQLCKSCGNSFSTSNFFGRGEMREDF
jgi:hypothetical protein